jgi:hypothetical protein
MSSIGGGHGEVIGYGIGDPVPPNRDGEETRGHRLIVPTSKAAI